MHQSLTDAAYELSALSGEYFIQIWCIEGMFLFLAKVSNVLCSEVSLSGSNAVPVIVRYWLYLVHKNIYWWFFIY